MNVQVREIVILMTVTFLMWHPVDAIQGAERDEKKSASKVEPTQEMDRIARLTVANELMRLHWETWVSGKELRMIAKQAGDEINHQLETRSNAEFLLPEVKPRPRPLDDFEKKSVEDVRAGIAEVWREVPGGTQYVRGIRATPACIQCHEAIGSPRGELGEGDLLGIISLKFKR